MAEKVSLLVFSRDNAEETLSVIRDMYGYVDEVVLFDSSKKSSHDRLLREKREKWLERLRIFYAIAFGYPDPLRMYALKKCRYDWVLLVDTDERLSLDFKKDIHSIIKDTRNSAFALRRYEDVSKEGRGAYSSWQIRLFRKDKTEFRGLIHEEPIIRGDLERLDSERYFIDHIHELRGTAQAGYSKMEKFMRMSYGSFNDIMLDYLYKFTMSKTRNPQNTATGKLAIAILSGYEKLGGKREDEEISNSDYRSFYALRSLTTSIKGHRPAGLYEMIPDIKNLMRRLKEWKSAPDNEEVFEISKILHKIGLIRFLELDKEKTIIYLNKKYRNKKQGVELLMNLLKEKYERQNPK